MKTDGSAHFTVAIEISYGRFGPLCLSGGNLRIVVSAHGLNHRVVVVLENNVLVVVNKDRNSIRFQYFWLCVVGLRKHLLG